MGQNNSGQNNHSNWEATDPDNERPQVTLADEFGRTLDCVIEFSLKFSGQEYALLQPLDYPVEIFSVLAEDEEETLLPLDESEIDLVFDVAKAILAEQNLILKRSAFSLTIDLEGEIPPTGETEIISLEIEDSDEMQDEEYQILGSPFFHQGRQYIIYMPLSPMLFVARLRPGHEPEVLSPQDFQHIQPLIEEHLEKHLVDFTADEDEWD